MGMVALNADKTEIVDADSAEAAYIYDEEELPDTVRKPKSKGKAQAEAQAATEAEPEKPADEATEEKA